ncbi:hypothetical protein [Wolbachia pipientis]|nr:hypothetical protein [Wolbachia pipientis]MBA8756947.1 hypothetical protein [Wolbachia pipientis]
MTCSDYYEKCYKLHSKWSVLGTGIMSSFVIPVPRHWDPVFHIISSKML